MNFKNVLNFFFVNSIHVYNILWSYPPPSPLDQLAEEENTWHGFTDEFAPYARSDHLCYPTPTPSGWLWRTAMRDSLPWPKGWWVVSLQLTLCHELARNSDLQGFMKCCWMIRDLRRSGIRTWKWVTRKNRKRRRAGPLRTPREDSCLPCECSLM